MNTKRNPLALLAALPMTLGLLAGCLVDAAAPEDTDPAESVGVAEERSSAPSGATLAYYGGPVVSNVKVVTLFWGGASKVNYSTKINAFYNGVTNSAYFDWLSEYNTPTQSIGRGTFVKAVDYTGSTSTAVTDAQVQTVIKNLVAAGTIVADANTVVAVHFAPGINITGSDGSKSCQVFCSYHGTFSYNGSYIYYTIVPDQGGSCAGGCGLDADTFNNLTSVASHELVDSVTDPGVGLATSYSAPLGWYDQVYGETGDICNAQQGTILGGDGVTYTVQKEYSNAAKDCIVSKGGSSGSSSSSSSSSSSGSGGSGGGGTCSHSECSTGTKLVKGCDACVTTVCKSDSYCCSTKWDSVCVSEAKSWCSGLTCH